MDYKNGHKTATVLAASGLTAFLIAALLGLKVIPALQRLKFGQTIRDIGPAWHRGKRYPDDGGLLFIGSTVLTFAAAIAVASFCSALEYSKRPI